METIKILKIAVFVLIIGYSLYSYLKKRKLSPDDQFLSLDDHRGNEILLDPKIPSTDFDSLVASYRDKDYDAYDNLFYKLSELLLDPLVEISNAQSEKAHFGMLNTSQRIYSLLLQFDGQINNGGLYQFFWNRVQSIYALKEALEKLNLKTLTKDYKKALSEFEAYSDGFIEDRKIWNDASASQEEKLAAFKKGYEFVPTAKKIEDYFYKDSFSKEFKEAVVSYVIKNKKHFGVTK